MGGKAIGVGTGVPLVVLRVGNACFDSLCADRALRCSFTMREVHYFILLQRVVSYRRKNVSEWYHVADRWRRLQGTVMSASGITSLLDGAGLVICIHGTRAVAARINRGCSLHPAFVSIRFERPAGVTTT